MTERFSPFTRRVLALGIAVLALLGLLNLVILPILGFTANRLSALEDARFRLARLEAIIARPPPERSAPVPASLYMNARSRQSATDTLISTIAASAARYEVHVDSIAPLEADPGRPKAIALSLAVRGEQDKMLAWINELERGQPAVHFATWSLGPDASGGDPAPLPSAAPAQAPSGPVQLSFSGAASAIWEQVS